MPSGVGDRWDDEPAQDIRRGRRDEQRSRQREDFGTALAFLGLAPFVFVLFV